MNRRRLLFASVLALLPATTAAQQRNRPVIGFLNGGTQEMFADRVDGCQRGLRDGGLDEGTVDVEYRWAEGR